MNDIAYKYDISRIEEHSINLLSSFDITSVILIAWMLVIWILAYVLIPILIWFFNIKADEKKKEKNREKIRELILMKEVQWELEKEIEASMLNEWLRSSVSLWWDILKA